MLVAVEPRVIDAGGLDHSLPVLAPALTAHLLTSPARLAAVVRSGLLDSEPEQVFDALTRMAATLLKVPASFVAVVDSDRDFYKSQTGFPDALAVSRQLQGTTFCHHTLARNGPLVIADTHASPTWQAAPSVVSLGVRSYVGIPLRLDGETIGSFCVFDQQPREWTAEEVGMLEQLALSAERELGLRVALRDAREDAARQQALVRAKEEMVAVIAHDLRTPLQVLSLSTVLLQRSCTPEQMAVANRMGSATDALERMADELLSDPAATPQPGARLTAVGATKLLADVVDTMTLIAARAEVELKLAPAAPDEPELSVDYAQMLRVFCNLVGNAIKYSRPGSQVGLGAAREADRVRLHVADTGCGMGVQEQQRAFDRGWQGAEGLARGDGAGLGLPIVKTLVERHGGTVSIASELGRGTIVTVLLPCR